MLRQLIEVINIRHALRCKKHPCGDAGLKFDFGLQA
jgi:hypothetical protein